MNILALIAAFGGGAFAAARASAAARARAGFAAPARVSIIAVARVAAATAALLLEECRFDREGEHSHYDNQNDPTCQIHFSPLSKPTRGLAPSRFQSKWDRGVIPLRSPNL